MVNKDTMYAVIHISWDKMIVVDTSPQAIDAMKRLFQEGNYYREEFINKQTRWVPLGDNSSPRIEIISRADFLKKTEFPKELAADNDNE